MQPGNLNGFDLITSSDSSVSIFTFNGVIGGGTTAGICAEGSSAVFLNAANTFSGGLYLGFSGQGFNTGGTWNFNNNSAFGTAPIYLLNANGGTLQEESGFTGLNIPNSFINYYAATSTVNLAGDSSPGLTFSGPFVMSGGGGGAGGGTYTTTAPLASYGPVNIGSTGSPANIVTISGDISGKNVVTKSWS